MAIYVANVVVFFGEATAFASVRRNDGRIFEVKFHSNSKRGGIFRGNEKTVVTHQNFVGMFPHIHGQRQIVTLLAFQIGKEVSLNELSRNVGVSVPTVERYLDLLEKTFVIFKICGFSRNLRSEITKTKRYYFRDNGVLNAVINNFNPLPLRNDIGALWENFTDFVC